MTRLARRPDVGAAVAGRMQATIITMDHATGINHVSDCRCLFLDMTAVNISSVWQCTADF